MAVGRITGPLLAKNLTRDGIDLSFETDLLYLDVINGRIGVKTTSPQYTLDVAGSTRAITLNVDTTSTLGLLTLSTTTENNTTIVASTGSISFQAGLGEQIILQSPVNITNNAVIGSANTNTLDIVSSIVSDIIPLNSGANNIGSESNLWANGYFEALLAGTLTGLPGQDVNITPSLGNITNINSDVRIWGQNPLGTAPVVSNVLYVSMDGSDTNDGRAQDATRACRTISGAIRSPFYKSGTSIKVASGHYYEDNPVELKPYSSVIGSDLRTTVIEPINKTQDLFHVQSGCYIAQLQMLNGRSGLLPGLGYTPGTNRGAYATSFPPNYSKAKIDLYHSPYIQNCTNQSGPWLKDGTLFVPNQTVQIPEAVGTSTWVANTTSLVVSISEGTLLAGQALNAGPTQPAYFDARTLLLANKGFIQEQVLAYVQQNNPGFVYNQAYCYRDVGIIVENIAYDAAFGGNQKSVESGLAYWDGVTSVIIGEISTTTSAINYINSLSQAIIINTSATNLLTSSTFTQVFNSNLTGGSIASSQVTNAISIINTIIENGPSAAPDIQVGAGPDWSAVSAEVLLQSNRSFIQNEVIDWINQTYPGFNYRQDICYRDMGLIIDAISQDIILNSNAKTIEAAKTYWTGNVNAVAGEVTETVSAINHARDVALQIIANTTATGTTQFVFNATKCSRDTGLIVDGLAQDLLFDGNSQSTFSGLQYWNHDSYVGLINSEITTTTAAINYISSIAQEIVQNITGSVPLGTRYQSTITQNTSFSAATISEANAVSSDFAVITNILSSGVTGVTDTIVPNSLTASTSTDIVNAYKLLQANINYLKAEAIAFIEATKTPNFVYNFDTCKRDVGYMVDSVCFDLLYGGNRQAVQSGVYYWNYSSVSTSLPKEQSASTLAYQYMKTLVEAVVTATPMTSQYSMATQNTSLPAATDIEVAAILENIDLITTIINAGPTSAPAKTSISLVSSTNQFVNNAVALLSANRSFIQTEVNAFVDATQVNDAQVILPFYSAGVNATLAVQRNFDIIANVVANGINVAPITTQGQGLFLTTGINASDTKTAPIITSVTSLGGNVYRVELSQSTVGYGENQSLYFGQTGVYPFLDADVSDRWAQRRLDPIGAMGGSLVDGGVISSRSPITSFVYDAFTQVNQGGVGIHITNNGYAQLVSVFTIFCSKAVIAENGGICSITNSNSNFGDQCLISKGYGKREFSGYIYNPPVAPYFPNGEFPKNGTVEVYIADPDLRPHIALVMEVEPPTGYINSYGLPGFISAKSNISTITTGTITLNGIDTTSMVIGQNIYIRDQYGSFTGTDGNPYVTTGTIITDINYQSVTLNYPFASGGGDINNTNFFNVYSCGNAYYTVLSSTVAVDPITPGTFLLPGAQGPDEVSALSYLDLVAGKVISNTGFVTLQTSTSQVIDLSLSGGGGAQTFVTGHINTIGSILTNGPSSAPTITKYGTLPSGSASAASLLTQNRTFLQDEIVAYVNVTYPPLVYNQATCERDTGLIVDAVTQDLLFSTSSQSTFAGIQYWSQDGYVGAIADELTTTTNTINYVSSLAQQIVQNITTGTRYSTSTQVTGTAATVVEADAISADFSVITNILTSGTVGVTDNIVPNSINSSTTATVVNAYNLLQTNKSYLQDEAIAYINANNPGFTYTTSTCARDVGYMVDSVSFDLLYGGNRQATQSGVYYYGYTTATVINNEIPATTAAYNFISSLTTHLILGEAITTYQTNVSRVSGATATVSESNKITASINTITNIINNGPSVADSARPISLTRSTNTNVIQAAEMLYANRAFIQAETVAYINKIFAPYNEAICRRDVGLLVDALVYDLENGGNYNSVIAGNSYYATTGTHHIVTLEESVSDPSLFPHGAIMNFYQRSYMSASGYLFEYVGAGTNYGALPQVGVADPTQSKEVVQLNNGKVFFTSTDQNGDFRIGTGLVISQATGVLSGRTFTKSLFANLTPFILAIEG